MKEKLSNRMAAMGILALLLLFGCMNKKEDHANHVDTEYTCPMHPQIVKDGPGSCPVCGMDLVAKATTSKDTVKISTGLAALLKSPNEFVVADIASIKPKNKTLNSTLKLPGIITYDTRNSYTIPARFAGRIEKLYLKFKYQPIQKGQKLAEIYSPDLVTAQRELIYLIQTDAGNQALIESAKRKLLLQGLTLRQVDEIIRSKKEIYQFPIYSPYSGYLADTEQSVPTSPLPDMSQSTGDGGMGASMGGQESTSPAVQGGATSTNPSSLIREGMYVSQGQTLFKIISPSVVWAEINLTSEQAIGITKGMPVAIKLNKNEVVDGKINLIQPFFGEGQQFVKVRISLANKNMLQIGQLVEAGIEFKNRAGLWVPASAILDLGTRKIAFLKKGNTFSATVVKTGERIDNQIRITSGLSSESAIAANAQFLIDSEGFIMTKNGSHESN